MLFLCYRNVAVFIQKLTRQSLLPHILEQTLNSRSMNSNQYPS